MADFDAAYAAVVAGHIAIIETVREVLAWLDECDHGALSHG